MTEISGFCFAGFRMAKETERIYFICFKPIRS